MRVASSPSVAEPCCWLKLACFIQIVAINDLTDSKTLAHLLKYDSLLGTLHVDVEADKKQLLVDGQPIVVSSERNPTFNAA